MKVLKFKYHFKLEDRGLPQSFSVVLPLAEVRESVFTNNSDNLICVCQFTGAKDVDGLEIYDGDICNNVKQDGKVYVGWNKMQHRWSYYDPIKDSVFCHLGQGDSDPVIIGNIYLNKELLNQPTK